MKKSFLLILLFFAFSGVIAQNDLEKTKATLAKSKIEGHVYFLASNELRGRNTGSPEIDIAASYLANTLRQYGVKPANNDSYYQQVKLMKTTTPEKVSLNLNEAVFDNLWLLDGANTNYNGDAVYVGYGWKEDYESLDTKEKLVIAKAGKEGDQDPEVAFGLIAEKRKIAKDNGAIGLIELSNIPTKFWNEIVNDQEAFTYDLGGQENNEMVHFWLNDNKGKIEKQFKKSQGDLASNLTISGIETTEISGKNVVGMVEGTDPQLKDEYVIYSAHYDHEGVGVPNAENDSIYNGARDNAIGTVTVLSAAENIAKYPTKRSALFILFTAEEKGLLGSRWYVEHPVIPLEKMVYCFNSDNGGYNDTTKATIIGLNRTTVDHHIINAAKEFGLEAIADPAPEEELFDRSDNVSFARKGIPAPTYSMGFTAFDEEILKYHHQVEDNPESLDYDYLFKFFSSYVLACRFIANDPETPFWVEGDKYYEAGKNLYKK